jgi:hypothetical protein
MSGAQGANPPGAQTSTTYSTAPNADTGKTAHRIDSTEDVKGLPVELAADKAPNPKESAGLGGPVFGANDGPDKGVTGSSFTA